MFDVSATNPAPGGWLVRAARQWSLVFALAAVCTSIIPTAYLFRVGSFGIAPHPLCLTLAAIGVLVTAVATRRLPALPAGALLLGLYLGWTTITAIFPSDPRATYSVLVRLWMSWSILVLLPTCVDDRRGFRALVAVLLLHSIVVVTVWTASSLANIGLPAFPSILSTQFQKNEYGSYLAFVLALALAVLVVGKGKGRLAAGVTLLVLISVSWPLTYSRSGLLAIASAIGVLVVCMPSRRLAAWLVVAATLAGLSFFLLPHHVREMSSRAVRSLYVRSEGDVFTRTIDERLMLNLAGLETLQDHPLFGVGYNEWKERSPLWVSVWDGKNNRPIMMGASIHNRYLLVAVESGLPALLAYVAFVGAMLRAARRASTRSPDADRTVLTALVAGVVGLLVANLFIPGNPWEPNLLGVLAAATRVLGRPADDPTPDA